MKIYIVTSGEYSDYGINRVFTDKERAELYCAMHENEYDPYTVEEWEADDVKIDTAKRYMRQWRASVYPSGEMGFLESNPTFKEKNTVAKLKNVFCDYYAIHVTLDKDKTEDEAKKIIFDRLAAWKYENEVEGGTR